MSFDEIEIIRSGRKTVCLEIRRDLSVVIRAPRKMKERDIEAFFVSRQAWLEKHLASAKLKNEAEKQQAPVQPFSEEGLDLLAQRAKTLLCERVKYYEPIVGVRAKKITVRRQVSRWGSCSSNGNLSFNCLLAACPPEVLDYVTVHELCHMKEMNHSRRFWSEVERVFPDYRLSKKWLKDSGRELIKRLRLYKGNN